MSFLTFLDEFGRIMKKEEKIQKIQKSKILTPYFLNPLNYAYSDSPRSGAPVYQIWGP